MSVTGIVLKGVAEIYRTSQSETGELKRNQRIADLLQDKVDKVEISLEGKYRQILEESMLEIVRKMI